MILFIMLVNVFFVALILFCVITFLFTYWRNLKDDYIPSQIFSSGLNVVFFAGLGYLMSLFFKNYTLWIVFVSLILGYIIGLRGTGIKFYESFDGFIISLLISFSISILYLIKLKSIQAFIFYFALLFSIVVFFLIKKYYKTFVWYKSGKRGFAGLFTLGVFFLSRSVISIFKPDFSILLTEYDIFFSGLISFISFLNIFILGR